VEFIVSADAPGEFFFMEMNTRLQVEHPVTELITGIDLVEWQLRIAAGESLDFGQSDVTLTGHAIEARIYAENPRDGFLPTGGLVLGLHEPHGPGIRVDSSLTPDLVVSPDYDPMLAKVIAWAPDRAGALARLRAALRETAVLGVTTNIEFLALLLADADVAAGRLDTELIGRRLDSLPFARADDALLRRAALVVFADAWCSDPGSRWQERDGWRLGSHAPSAFRLSVAGEDREAIVRVWGTPAAASVSVDGSEPLAGSIRLDGASAHITLGGRTGTSRWARSGGTLHLSEAGCDWAILLPTDAARTATDSVDLPELRSPMPGAIVAVHVADGEIVAEGAAVIVVEAMKMEHVLRATSAGRVELHVALGAQVSRDQLLATVRPAEVG
jgi:acetyl-CoA/propionyl-CoA carboxylase biotin carboxyl carrier protein